MINELNDQLNQVGLQVFTSVTSGLDLHDNEGNWIDTFEDSSELLFWVTNN